MKDQKDQRETKKEKDVLTKEETINTNKNVLDETGKEDTSDADALAKAVLTSEKDPFDFPIEEGVDIPPVTKEYKNTVHTKLIKKFDELEVGKSFFIPHEVVSNLSVPKHKAEIEKELKEKYNNDEISFVTRRIKNEAGQTLGVRVWRVK